MTIRGHHIEALAEIFARKNGYYRIEEGKSPEQLKLERLNAAFIRDYGQEEFDKLEAEEKSRPPIMGYDYERIQQEKRAALDALFNDLLSNTDIELTIENSPDSVCKACPANKDCSGARSDSVNQKEDVTPLAEYGILEGKKYTVGDLIGIFRDYLGRTNFPSPRTKRGFGRQEYDTIVRDRSVED